MPKPKQLYEFNLKNQLTFFNSNLKNYTGDLHFESQNLHIPQNIPFDI
jgi:hypothetical protein